MQNHHRRLLAVAVTGLCAPFIGHAQDAVQLYGLVDMYAGTAQASGEPQSTRVVNSGGMTTSFWGVRGSESLGAGMRAVFDLQGYLLADTGGAGRFAGDPLFSKSAYVGLAGNWGELRLGRQVNPLFYASAAANPFGASTRFSPLMTQSWIAGYGRSVAGDTSWDNVVSYTSPQVGGVRGAVFWGQGEVANDSGMRNLGLVLNYAAPALSLSLDVQRTRLGAGLAQGQTQNTWFAGGSYAFKPATAYFSYGGSSADVSDLRSHTAQAGVSVPAARGSVLFSWAAKRERAPAGETRRNSVGLGYDYPWSARTDTYATVLYDKTSNAASATAYGLGIRHRF